MHTLHLLIAYLLHVSRLIARVRWTAAAKGAQNCWERRGWFVVLLADCGCLELLETWLRSRVFGSTREFVLCVGTTCAAERSECKIF